MSLVPVDDDERSLYNDNSKPCKGPEARNSYLPLKSKYVFPAWRAGRKGLGSEAQAGIQGPNNTEPLSHVQGFGF